MWEEFLARDRIGAGQDGGGLRDYICECLLYLSLLQTLSSRPGWEPALSPGGSGAKLQHDDGGKPLWKEAGGVEEPH